MGSRRKQNTKTRPPLFSINDIKKKSGLTGPIWIVKAELGAETKDAIRLPVGTVGLLAGKWPGTSEHILLVPGIFYTIPARYARRKVWDFATEFEISQAEALLADKITNNS